MLCLLLAACCANALQTILSISGAAAAAAKSLQSCPTLCDPKDGSPPGSPVTLGFSRQEHWSGLPFPSPMHESGKWKWSRSVASNSSRPHGLQPTRLLHPWDFPGKSTGVGCHRLLRSVEHGSPIPKLNRFLNSYKIPHILILWISCSFQRILFFFKDRCSPSSWRPKWIIKSYLISKHE